MPWRSLGTLTPDLLEWRLTNTAALGDLVRVRQDWSGDWPGTGFIMVSAFYADGGRYGFESVYPDREARMLILPPPQILADAGLLVRYFAAKLNSRSRTYDNANWSITFEEFTPITGPDDQPVQTVDGGTYDGL